MIYYDIHLRTEDQKFLLERRVTGINHKLWTKFGRGLEKFSPAALYTCDGLWHKPSYSITSRQYFVAYPMLNYTARHWQQGTWGYHYDQIY